MRRPLCVAAVILAGLALLFLVFTPDGQGVREEGSIQLAGRVIDKQLQESSWGSGWQLTLDQVEVEEADGADKALLEEGKILCTLSPGEDAPMLGEQVRIRGKTRVWEPAGNPGQFDFGDWYRSQGYSGQLQKGELLQRTGRGSPLREGLWQLRQWSAEVFLYVLGEENGPLVAAMTVGEDEGLSEELEGLYQRNGISHIISISGLHLMLLGMGAFGLIRRFPIPLPAAVLSSMALMCAYCVFSGGSVATVRATIMFCVFLSAKLMGRSYDSLSALGLASILQLLSNPRLLMNGGFQLSYLAVVGVSAAVPRLKVIFSVNNKALQAMLVSVGVSLATLPVMLYHFGTYPWHSILVNLLIVPGMSLLLWLALLILFLAALFSPALFLCKACGWVIGAILFYYKSCCLFFESLPVWTGYQGRPLWGCILLYYGALTWILFVPHGKILGRTGRAFRKVFSQACRRDLRRARKPAYLLGLLACAAALFFRPEEGMEITLLDVGQGDGMVVRSSSGRVYIWDFGSSSVSGVGTYRLLPFLQVKGYGEIEAVFISHLDSDHYSGILELLEAAGEEHIQIRQLYLPGCLEEEGEKLAELLEMAEAAGAPVSYLHAGDLLKEGETSFLCLHPDRGDAEMDSNNGSLVLAVEYGAFSMLLTGDIEKASEEKILERVGEGGLIQTAYLEGMSALSEDFGGFSVLKVGHHGSSGSSSAAFLEWASPGVSLISAGRENSYGHPHEETLERLGEQGALIYSTQDSGAITLWTDGEELRIEEFLVE